MHMAFFDNINGFFNRTQDYFESLDTLALGAWGAILVGVILIVVGLLI